MRAVFSFINRLWHRLILRIRRAAFANYLPGGRTMAIRHGQACALASGEGADIQDTHEANDSRSPKHITGTRHALRYEMATLPEARNPGRELPVLSGLSQAWTWIIDLQL